MEMPVIVTTNEWHILALLHIDTVILILIQSLWLECYCVLVLLAKRAHYLNAPYNISYFKKPTH